MSQKSEVIGQKGPHKITRIEIELPKGDDVHFVRAVCFDDFGITEICEAPLINDIAAHLGREFGVPKAYLFERHEFRMAYNQRFIAAEQFNHDESKKAGMMSQFEAGTVIYSLITHAPYRIAKPNQPTDERAGYVELVRQRIGVDDPDECLIDSEQFDTVQEATFAARNHIERDLFICFTGQ